ncbi:hypothetical protein GOV11_01980 [Candidatus Woesearchaeota archaeon]|nr:hypothetical protein [Candidatus Woesearchaeota archaeon]
MADEIISVDDLKKLSPEERIRILKELAEKRSKELEEQLAETEDLIKESEEEVEEELRQPEEQEEENLEEMLQKSAPDTAPGETGPDYSVNPTSETASPLYQTLENASEEFDNLYSKQVWTPAEEQVYREFKERVEHAQSYVLTSDKLEEELGLATNMLNRLKYRNT